MIRKPIIFKGKDGSIAIMTLAPGARKSTAIRKFHEAHPDQYHLNPIEGSPIIPENRIFRDAWTIKDNEIVIDHKKAENIHLDRIRKARNDKLKVLDVETLKALTNPEKLQEIERQKQSLRDLPKTIKLTNLENPEWPQELQ